MAEIRQTAESLLDNTSLAGFWNFQETFQNEYKEILKNADNQQRSKLREKFRKAKAKRKKQQKSNQQKKQESKEKIEKNKQKTKNENQRQEYLRKLARQKVVKEQKRHPSQQEDHMVINRAAIQKNFSAIQKNILTLQKLETQPKEKCSIKFKKQNMNLDSIIEKAKRVAFSNNSSLKTILQEYKNAKMSWKKKCLFLKKEKLTSMIDLDEMSYLNNLLKPGELCPDFNAANMIAPCNFWLKAFTGTINIALTNETAFPGIGSQFVGPTNVSNWYRRGYYGAYLSNNKRFQNSYFLQELAHVEIMKDLVQNIFSDGLMIAKGDLIVIPSLADIKQGGVIYNAYKSRHPGWKFNDEIPIENWEVIGALRDVEKETANNATYWEINNKQRGVEPPRQTIQNINDNNYEALLKNVPKVFANRPELYLRYVVNNYKNNGKDYDQGIITWVNVKAGGSRSPIYQLSTLNPAADMRKSKYFEVNHANLIFFTPVHVNDDNTHLKCSYYDPNNSIELHVKALIRQMIDNLRTKVVGDNIIIKDEIDWISPEDITNTIAWHGLFGYATHGVCAQVTYLFALLWGKFGLYFRNPKHLWCHLSRTLNWSIPALNNKQKQKLLIRGIKPHSLEVHQRLNQLIPSFKSFLQRIMLLGDYLYEDLDSKRYVTALITMIMKVEKMYKLGEKIGGGKKGKKVKKNQQIGGGKKGKKVRKHQGILQIGGNSGRLKKGYRYSGKKLKSGLPQIIKCKSKKC